MLSREDLIEFERDIGNLFAEGEIHAPVHLSGGNEDQLLQIFEEVRPEDWVFSTWRSHYHALLKGIPRAEVRRQILAGRSMFICSPEHNFYASSIMGGTLPIACGVAAAGHRVWCFVGDMCASIGAYRDAFNFAVSRNLRMIFVVEDNGLSTNTPTEQAWGFGTGSHVNELGYKYVRTYPHYQSLLGRGRGF